MLSSSLSCAAWSPTENLFMPHFKYMSIFAADTVPGFISMVISALSFKRKFLRTAATSMAISCSSMMDGVPPPMYSVSKV